MSKLKYHIKKFIQERGKTREGEKLLRQRIRAACNGLSANQLSAWENYKQDEKHTVGFDNMLNIALVLEVDVNELYNPLPVKKPEAVGNKNCVDVV